MARKRCKMKAIRRIIEFFVNTKLSRREISRATGVSRPTVDGYIEAFKQSGLTLAETDPMPDSALIAKLSSAAKENPRLVVLFEFFPYVQRELARIGVTRELLWQEYREKHPDGYAYSQFCEHYGRWLKRDPEVTAWMEHAAGDRMYVDFTGKKTGWLDRETGVFHEAELFVALLAASQYTYAEAVVSQRKDDWIAANCNALEAFGGVPACIVPDCLKSAVTKGDKYEPDLNPDYEDFARHYGTVILPARPHHPRDKALVEGAVRILYTRIFAVLRNRKFYSLVELNAAIREEVAAHNRRRFQRARLNSRPSSRTRI